jgi:hypothetical protein
MFVDSNDNFILVAVAIAQIWFSKKVKLNNEHLIYLHNYGGLSIYTKYNYYQSCVCTFL